MPVDRLQKEQSVVSERGLDALVCFSPENVAYGAGYMIPSQYVPIRKRVFATVATPDRAAMVVAPVELNEAHSSSVIDDVRTYDEFSDDPMAVIADVLDDFGARRGRIGVEVDFLPGRHWDSLRAHLPDATLVDAEGILAAMRAVKTPEEIGHMRTLAEIVATVHRELAKSARVGWSEREMARFVLDRLLAHGADGVSLLVVGSGERSVFANCPPTDRVVGPGDLVRVDIFAHKSRYLSDIARTLVAGPPSAEQRDIWRKLCDAETALLEWIRPGAGTLDVMKRFVRLFDEMGLESAINFVGHSIGMTLHEEPFFNLVSDDEIEEGMVFAIEPVYFRGKWGFHLEDEIVVTADGCELLSDGRGDLPVLS